MGALLRIPYRAYLCTSHIAPPIGAKSFTCQKVQTESFTAHLDPLSSRPLFDIPTAKMSAKGSSVSEDSFEFVETPAAPSPAPVTTDYGVRTTSVRLFKSEMRLLLLTFLHRSIPQLRMLRSQPTAPVAIPSTPSSS